MCFILVLNYNEEIKTHHFNEIRTKDNSTFRGIKINK